MRFADELVGSDELTPPDVKLSDRELAMARTLVGELVAPFEPSKLPDEYRARVLAAASAKVEGGEAAALPAKGESADVIDLADLLAASLKKRSA